MDFSQGWPTMMRRVMLSIAALLVAGAARADLLIQGYQPRLHDRFYTGTDRAFIGQGEDFSGVGKATTSVTQDDQPWGVLISPSFYLTSVHFQNPSSISFHENDDPNGPVHTYHGAATRAITTGTDSTDLLLVQ